MWRACLAPNSSTIHHPPRVTFSRYVLFTRPRCTHLFKLFLVDKHVSPLPACLCNQLQSTKIYGWLGLSSVGTSCLVTACRGLLLYRHLSRLDFRWFFGFVKLSALPPPVTVGWTFFRFVMLEVTTCHCWVRLSTWYHLSRLVTDYVTISCPWLGHAQLFYIQTCLRFLCSVALSPFCHGSNCGVGKHLRRVPSGHGSASTIMTWRSEHQ